MPIVRACLPRQRPCLYLSPSRVFLANNFHTSSTHRDNNAGLPDHYATLNLSPNASPAEVKKQFYALSKSHHPDLHPNDPNASQRFVAISEAYSTLGSPDKRARYDRDFLRTTHAAQQATPSGSFSSASTGTPFGARPASGLSRRRTQFRGPPPSFYRSGGYGSHSEKRRSESEKSSHTHEAQGRAWSNNPSATPGMGPGGMDAGFDSVPHFDHRGHYERQSGVEATQTRGRRQRRDRRFEALEREEEGGGGGSVLFNFMWVSGMILGLFWAGGAFWTGERERRAAVRKVSLEGNGNGIGGGPLR